MNPTDLAAQLQINGDRRGGIEPWGRSTSIQFDAAGFSRSDELGRGAAPQGAIPVDQVAALLLDQFDRNALLAVLDHIVALRAALAAG
jgi:hypothetical protein